MSFRKRNVVLSTASSDSSLPLSAENQPPPPPPQQRTPLTSLQAARGLSLRQPAPARAPPAARTPPTARTPPSTSTPLQPLPDVTSWTLATRVDLPDERRAQIQPAKQRLRALLEQERRQRRSSMTLGTPSSPPPLGPGARPSPFDGRPITSTGTASLDPLLAGYGGLALGHSLLVEEQGTTDFASVLLRAFAAEGLVQGHHVHVLGVGPAWKNELPGLASSSSSSSSSLSSSSSASSPSDKMKIAWRYETLSSPSRRAPGAPSSPLSSASAAGAPPIFCHTFDLSKRLTPADSKSGTLHPVPLPNPLLPSPTPEESHSPLRQFLAAVRASLDATPPSTIHRVILPSFLAPSLYAMDGWSFPYVLSLLLGLRSLLRRHSRRLCVVLALSTSLFDRADYCVRQLERLCDTIVELIPLPPGPPSMSAPSSSSSSSSQKTPADKMQGWFKVHKLQVYSETGGAGASPQGTSLRENFCFSVSASRGMEISPYSLPPVEDDSHAAPASAAQQSMEF